MKIIIDTRNGIAGDIVSAGLIGLGADERRMVSSIRYAGNYIGTAQVTPLYHDNTVGLEIKIQTYYGHLREFKIKDLWKDMRHGLKIDKECGNIATKVLEFLCAAERYVHRTDERLHHMLYHHEGHKKGKRDEASVEAFLHESQDILVDIVGLSIGLEDLGVREIGYLDYVNVGNGTINFSHGEFEVPTPATKYLLDKHKITYQKSDTYEEMTTPTGASILAGCNAERIENLEGYRVVKKALARGTKDLPPVPFYLVEKLPE